MTAFFDLISKSRVVGIVTWYQQCGRLKGILVTTNVNICNGGRSKIGTFLIWLASSLTMNSQSRSRMLGDSLSPNKVL